MSTISEKLREAIKDLWREVGPFLKHGFSISCLILIASGIIRLLETFLPPDSARALDEIDLYLIKALFWLFGGYTFLMIANRLVHYLSKEVAETWRKPSQTGVGALQERDPKLIRENLDGSARLNELLSEVVDLRTEVAELRVEVRERRSFLVDRHD